MDKVRCTICGKEIIKIEDAIDHYDCFTEKYNTDGIERIKQIRKKLKEFDKYNLKVGLYSYCGDFVEAQNLKYVYCLSDIEVCRELTKDKLKYKQEHRLLTIICSYLDELTILLEKHPEMIDNG